jgi:hypothetical protein
MSKPANPLDVFTTYTYHFELHAAYDWQDIILLESTDQNLSTTATSQTKTTLINTRKDAHQSIDDVVFSYIGGSANRNGLYVPGGSLTLKVLEPNKIYFIEKIANVMKNYNVTSLGSLHWALKVFFVGRKEDNSIHTLPYPGVGVVIPIAFVDMDSTFTYQGGEYALNFVTLSGFAGADDTDESLSNSLLAGYCNKNISVTAKSVKEALEGLKNQLNINYKETYATELLNDKGSRPLKYYINVDPEVDGTLDISVGAESFAPGGYLKMQFDASQTILSWIFHILRASNSLNALVGKSLDAIRKDGQPGVNILSVYPAFIETATECQIIYNISLYKGENSQVKGLKSNTMEFDFLFSDPGKNVDVISFDIHMKSALNWFSNNTQASVDAASNISSTNTKNPDFPKNTLVPNQTKNSIVISNNTTRYRIPTKKGDPAYLNSSPQSESSGQIKYREGAVENAKLMFNSLTQMHGAFDPMFTFTIRGHLDLLTAGIFFPKNEVGKAQDVPFGIRAPLWIKVNIKSPNDHKSAFFYTGRYNVLSIENRLSQGKFIQTLGVIMMNEAGV